MKNLTKFFGITALVAAIVIGFVGCEGTGTGGTGTYPEYSANNIPQEWQGTWTNDTFHGVYTLYLTSNSARLTGTGSKGTASGATYYLPGDFIPSTNGRSAIYYFGTDRYSPDRNPVVFEGTIERPRIGVVSGFGTGANSNISAGTWKKQ